jgi:hypothetical protein
MSEKIESKPIGTTDKPNSPTIELDESERENCIWNGHVYSPGAVLCQGPNKRMICQSNGHWIIIVASCP